MEESDDLSMYRSCVGSLKARKQQIQGLNMCKKAEKYRQNDSSIVYHSRIKIPGGRIYSTSKERWLTAMQKAASQVQNDPLDGVKSGNRRPDLNIFSSKKNVKERCAESMYNLSRKQNSEVMIINADAIEQIADFCDCDDTKLLKCCAATLANLTTNEEIYELFYANGGISAILELCWSPSNQIKYFCVVALCRLSCNTKVVKFLQTSRAIVELSSLIVCSNIIIQKLALQTISNLIFHGCQFPDRIYSGGGSYHKLGIVGVLTNFASETSTYIFAAQLTYNLSSYERSTVSLLYCGISETILTLCQLCYNRNDSELAHLIVDALSNFSNNIECLPQFSAHGSKIIWCLLSLNDPVVLPQCCRILANFTTNLELCVNFCNHNLLPKMFNLVNIKDDIVNQNVVRFLSNLTCSPECTKELLELGLLGSFRDILDNTVRLNKKVNIDGKVIWSKHDKNILFDILTALVNIARLEEFHRQLLELSIGELIASIGCKNDTEVRRFCGKAIFNITCSPKLRGMIRGDHVAQVLVDYLKDKSNKPHEIQQCLGSICCISNDLFDIENARSCVDIIYVVLQSYIIGSIDTICPTTNKSIDLENKAKINKRPTFTKSVADTDDDINEIMDLEKIEFFCIATLFNVSRLALRTNTEPVMKLLCESKAMKAICTLTEATKFEKTRACCTGIIYHLCAFRSEFLFESSTDYFQEVLRALVCACIHTEDLTTLMSCSASFLTLSFSENNRRILADIDSICLVLNKLGRSSSVECQQYAAIAACNIATVKNVWTPSSLKDFVVVILLRANSSQAKQVHAKTLYNILAQGSIQNEILDDKALYGLIRLAQGEFSEQQNPILINKNPDSNDNLAILNTIPKDDNLDSSSAMSLCLHALYNLSLNSNHHKTLMELGVVQFLYIVAGTKGFKSMVCYRRKGAAILCNISYSPSNHEVLIVSQITDVIRVLCKANDVETRIHGAMVLRNLTSHGKRMELLCSKKIISLLMVFTRSTNELLRQLSVEALCNYSLHFDCLHVFLELNGCAICLDLLEKNPTKATFIATIKLIHNMSMDNILAEKFVEIKIISRFLKLEYHILSECMDAKIICALAVRVISTKESCIKQLLDQGIIRLCVSIITCTIPDEKEDFMDLDVYQSKYEEIALECLGIIGNLSYSTDDTKCMIHSHSIEAIKNMIDNDKFPIKNNLFRQNAAITLRNLSLAFLCKKSCPTETDAKAGNKTKQRISKLYHYMCELVGQTQSFIEDAATARKINLINFIFKRKLSQKFDQQGIADIENEVYNKVDYNLSSFELESLSIAIDLLQGLVQNCNGDQQTLIQVSCALFNICSVAKSIREKAIDLDVMKTLLTICNKFKDCVGKNENNYFLVEQICSFTLHHLAIEDNIILQNGLVEALLNVLKNTDDDLSNVQRECRQLAYLLKNNHVNARQGENPETAVDLDKNTKNTLLVGSDKCCRQACDEVQWMRCIIRTEVSSTCISPQLPVIQMSQIRMPLKACDSLVVEYSSKVMLMKTDMEKKGIDCSYTQNATDFDNECNSSATLKNLPSRRKTKNSQNNYPENGGGNSQDKYQTMLHAKNFDNQMRLTRRSCRKNATSLPAIE